MNVQGTGVYSRVMTRPSGLRVEEAAPVLDPLQFELDLPLRAEFYPLGFPLGLETNSAEVIAAAAESWGAFRPAFDRAPLRVRVAVSDDGAGEAPPDPSWSGQQHLMAIVSDSRHYAVCDFERGFAFCRLSRAAAANRAWMRFHYLETIAYSTLAVLYLAPVHAACVAREGFGVLLAGASGAGKSSLALACARRGWTYLSDDSSFVELGGDGLTVIGRPHQIRFRESAAELFPELQGRLAQRRPNGRTAIEVRTSDLPGVRTANQCRAGAVVFLDRREDGPAGLAELDAETALARCMEGSPTYGSRVRSAHEEALRRLAGVGAYELTYSRLEDAVGELERLAARGGAG